MAADLVRETVDSVYRAESRRILATLIRLLGDFDVAEDALHEAFRTALEQWGKDGVPANPRAWLVSTGRFKAIDALRRRARFDGSQPALAERLPADAGDPTPSDDEGSMPPAGENGGRAGILSAGTPPRPAGAGTEISRAAAGRIGLNCVNDVDFRRPRPTTGTRNNFKDDREENMKYICLGYWDEKEWKSKSESELHAAMDECFAYDDVLRKNGHFAGGEALQSARNAATLRWKNGKVTVTDGPYAETKEQLGGILILEARDLNHAIQLMSKHPGVKIGPFEIRPADDLSAMVAESGRRRGTAA